MHRSCWPAASALAWTLGGCRPTIAPHDAIAPAPGIEVAPRPSDVFLRLDADLAGSYPLRARIIRGAAVYPEHDGKPEGDPSGRTMSLEVTVLDPDAHGDPLRPRVLCERASHRIAVHVDIDDVAVVAREGAVMAGSPHTPSQWTEQMAGVRLLAGTALRIEGGLDRDHVRAVLDVPSLHAAGWIDRAHVGHTWVPAALPEPVGLPDLRVREPTALLATAGGAELARLDPRMAPAGMFVRRLGPAQGDFVLVRHDGERTRSIGWIAAAAVEPFAGMPTAGVTTVWRGRSEPIEPTVELVRGTLLRGGALRDRIGVVTETARFHCLDGCGGAQPRVEVDACTTAIGVWAEPPSPR
jgi:hypothetical protein